MESAPADQRLAYNVLIVSFATFSDAHLRHETCLSTRPCAPLQAAEKAELDRIFLGFAKGLDSFQALSDQDFQMADQILNINYQRLFDALPVTCPDGSPTCLSQTSLRDVERDWIRYRDAWTIFGTLRWPNSTSNYWKIALTGARSE